MPKTNDLEKTATQEERDQYGYGDASESAGIATSAENRFGRRRTILDPNNRVETETTKYLDRKEDPLIQESKGVKLGGLPSSIEQIGEIGDITDDKADKLFQERLRQQSKANPEVQL